MSNAEKKYILAIDLGTSGAKVALVSVHGEVLGWEDQRVRLHVLPGGGAEQDPADWWDAILTTSRKLLAQGLAPVEDIVAVCATTQGGSTIAVDQNGQHLMNSISWLDTRGSRHAQKVADGLLKIEGYDIFKILRWMRITGGAPSLAGKDQVGHQLFIKYERPEIYEKTYKFLNVLDYINLRLTGEFVATGDSVMDAWVTDNRDPYNICYHDGLLKKWPIEREKYPEIKRGIDVIGALKPEVADQLGLSHKVKVVAGAIDIPAAAIGAGAVKDFDAHLYIGTSSWLAAHVPFKKTDLFNFIASLPCSIPGKYLMIATQDTAGGNLLFLRDNIVYPKDEFHQGELYEDEPAGFFKFFDSLNSIAEKVPAGSNGVLYTPWLFGERVPVDDPTVRAALYNLSLENTREDIVRAIMEGVALNTRWLINPMEKFIGGRALDPINMVGGGATSRVWCQIMADVLNRSIRQVRDPIQANARGAAFIASVGLGHISFDDVPRLIQFDNVFQPNAEHRQLYDELFEIFVEIYKKNKGIYQRLNKDRS